MAWLVLVVWLGCSGRTDGVPEDFEPADKRDADYDGFWVFEDCAPFDPDVSPADPEDACNWRDDDCDGAVDEGREAKGFYDADGDGFGDFRAPVACAPPREVAVVSNADDCDDAAPGVHPGVGELCDGLDDDCDGDVDEDAPDATAWHYDADGDGFGAGEAVIACAPPSAAYVADATDCDDAEERVHPGALESCNGRDDDCDGVVDPEGAPLATWYADADGDGFGTSATRTACAADAGWAEEPGDCDDADASAFPGAREVCADGRDSDCDGISACEVADADADVRGPAGFGATVAGLGDTDGDGFDDVVVGGGCGVWLLEGPLADGLGDTAFVGEHDQDCLGEVLTAGGDLDGDGVRDVLLRAADHGLQGFSSEGAVVSTWVVSGAARGAVDLGDAVAKLPGQWPDAGDVAAADLDGDGADDLVVVEPGDRQGGIGTGSTFVFSGPVAGELDRYEARTRLFGPARSFASMSGPEVEAGDVDGDGLAELLIVESAEAWLLSELPAGGLKRSDEARATFAGAFGGRILDADGDGRAEVFTSGGPTMRIFAGPLDGAVDAQRAVASFEARGRTLWDVTAGDAGLLVHGRWSDDESVGWLVEGPLSGTRTLYGDGVVARWGGPGVGRFAGDLDGDHADDVVLTDAGEGQLYVLSGGGL